MSWRERSERGQSRARSVKTSGEAHLSNDDHVEALGDVLLEGRVLEEAVARKVGGSNVGVQAELLSEFEQTLLGPDRTNSPLGTTNRTCKGK